MKNFLQKLIEYVKELFQKLSEFLKGMFPEGEEKPVQEEKPKGEN